MGSTYEVWALMRDGNPHTDEYHYERVYEGESWDDALSAMHRAKESGSGCVKLEWRG